MFRTAARSIVSFSGTTARMGAFGVAVRHSALPIVGGFFVAFLLVDSNDDGDAFAAGGGTTTFTGIGDLPGGNSYSRAMAVSADGSTVVGSSEAAGDRRAISWSAAGGLVDLGSLPGGSQQNEANGVSEDGSIIVGRCVIFGDATRAFRWTAESGCVSLGVPPMEMAGLYATSVSDDGSVVVGTSNDFSGPQAFRWTASTGFTELWDLPGGDFSSSAQSVSGDGSVIVGHSASSLPMEPFRWTALTGMVGLGDIPGGTGWCYTMDVSADGSVVVGMAGNSSAHIAESFRWTQATGMVGLGHIPGGDGGNAAVATNGDGSIVVGLVFKEGDDDGFIWSETGGMRDLRTFLETDHGLDLSGWGPIQPTGISWDGLTIVGQGRNPSEHTEGWVASLGDSRSLRSGNVGAGSGLPPTDVLFVNGSAGDPVSRRVTVTAGTTVTIHIDKAPGIVGSAGHYAFWIYDGEQYGCLPVAVRPAQGAVFALGQANRRLPVSNTISPGSCPCPVSFPVGCASRPLGASLAAALCMYSRTAYTRSPTDLTVIFPKGRFSIYSLHLDPNSLNSPTLNLSLGNTVVVISK